MAIRNKSREEVLNQTEGFLEYAEKEGKIDKDKSKEILELFAKSSDILKVEDVEEQLGNDLNLEELKLLYVKYLRIRAYILSSLPKEYAFLVNDFLNEHSRKIQYYNINSFKDELLDLKKNIKLIKEFITDEKTLLKFKEIIINGKSENLKAIMSITTDEKTLLKFKEIIISGKSENLKAIMSIITDENDLLKMTDVIINGKSKISSGCHFNNIETIINVLGINEVKKIETLKDIIINTNPEYFKIVIETLKEIKILSVDDLIVDLKQLCQNYSLMKKYQYKPDELKLAIQSLYWSTIKTLYGRNTSPDVKKSELKDIESFQIISSTKGYGNFIKEVDKMNYDDNTKFEIINYITSLSHEDAKVYLKIVKSIDNLVSNYIQIIKNDLIYEISKLNNLERVDKYIEQIVKIFVRNNIPLTVVDEVDKMNYDDNTKFEIINYITSLSHEDAKVYLKIVKSIDNSVSNDIQIIKNELIYEISKLNNLERVDKYVEQIIQIFERNNLPLIGKNFKVFEILYPKSRIQKLFEKFQYSSPKLESLLNEWENFYDLIYRDLMNIAIKSGDHSLRDYLNTFVGSEKLLKKFEDIVSSDGFNGSDPLCLEDKLEEDEQAKLLYLFRKISVLYNRYFGSEINEGNTIEDKKYGESTVADNQLVEFYNDIKKGFNLRDGKSIYDRLQTLLYVNGLKYHSVQEVLDEMNKSKKQAHERGLKRYNKNCEYGNFQIPTHTFSKGITKQGFSKILNRGIVSSEYLGGGDDGKPREEGGTGAGSTITPFDIDGRYTASNKRDDEYGNISLIIDMEKWNQGEYECFPTALGSTYYGIHYGIRTGIPMTEVDYMIYHGDFKSIEFQDMCYEIARNGYYIPIVDNEGNVKFTPEMYHKIRLGFNYMQYYDGFDVEFKDGKYVSCESDCRVNKGYSGTNGKINDEELRKLIDENSPGNDKYKTFAKENRELAKNTIKRIKRILEEKCGIKFNSEFDTSITGAELYDSGSTGRGTDIPTKDVDLDFTLILDSKDYEKMAEISKVIHEEIGTQEDDDHLILEGNQIKSKINNIGKSEERPNGIPLDLLILKKSQVIDYSSSDAMKEKLEYIASNPNSGAEDLERVRANVIIMKKLLKAKSCYKHLEGGFAGIGVENWITQNHGNFIEALESFEQVAYGGKYEEGRGPKLLSEFQELYPIYDAGKNYKDGCNDNFIYQLSEHGYDGILQIVKALRTRGIDGIRKIIKEYEEKKAKFNS